jgi:L-alanine-DL-glutamate epimerase-like enolase superfamily enzyme
MKINDLELFLVADVPEESEQTVRSLLVRLVTDGGMKGWGEAASGWKDSELSARQNSLTAVLKGRSVYDIEELHTLDILSAPGLRCAVEMAFWDLLGKSVGQPLYNLFGGIYRKWIPQAVQLPDGRPERVGKIARELVDQGFHTQVIASTGRLDDDVKIIKAIRENVGDRVQLRLDGKLQFSNEKARELCGELEFADLDFILDPINSGELYPLASLGRQTIIPMAAWRAINSPGDVLAAVRCGAVKHLIVDIERVGGVVPARQCAAIASAAQIHSILGGGPSFGPGTAAILHLAAATAAFTGCQECSQNHLRDTVLKDTIEPVDGMIAIPQSPGLGVRVDRAKIEKYMAI